MIDTPEQLTSGEKTTQARLEWQRGFAKKAEPQNEEVIEPDSPPEVNVVEPQTAEEVDRLFEEKLFAQIKPESAALIRANLGEGPRPEKYNLERYVEAEESAEPEESEADSDEEMDQKFEEVMDRYGFDTNEVKFLDDNFDYVDELEIVDVDDHPDLPCERFTFVMPGKEEEHQISGYELLDRLQGTDRNILSEEDRLYSGKTEGIDPRILAFEKINAIKRNELREEFALERAVIEHSDEEPRMKDRIIGRFKNFSDRAKSESIRAFMWMNDEEKGTKRKVSALLGGLVLAAATTYALSKWGIDTGSDQQKVQKGISTPSPDDGSSQSLDSTPQPKPKAGGEVQQPSPNGDSNGQENVTLEIKKGEGFTDGLDRYADSQGVDTNGAENFQLYKKAEAQGMFDSSNSYDMTDGNKGALRPGEIEFQHMQDEELRKLLKEVTGE